VQEPSPSKEKVGSWSEVNARLVVLHTNYRRHDEVCASMTIGNGMDEGAGLLISERITHGVAPVRYLQFPACHVEAGHHRILQVNDVTYAPIDDSAV
jgi:hypothetical protein